jgi:trimeric autotransporter adhesin
MKPNALYFILFALLTYFAAVLGVEAVVPTPDGCYPNFTTAEGCNALQSLTTGAGNTAVGWRSLFLDTTGSFNTAVGAGTLALNTGEENTATGAGALLSNTTANGNTADGAFALVSNTTGVDNTAIGVQALFNNTTANGNTADGAFALVSNTTGADNTAVGDVALDANTTGVSNTAIGTAALASNTTANGNTATGYQTLFSNTTGANNTAAGYQALSSNTIGHENTAIGYQALSSNTIGQANTAIGPNALPSSTTGFGNTAIGSGAGSNVITAGGVTCIGANIAGADVSNTCFIGYIRGMTTQNNDAIPVLIDSNDQLGTASSSRRYKTAIKPMDKASESILALKPVSFRYKVHKDSTPQFGLIAEDVAEVNPDLVIYDAGGKPYTVRYEAVNAMLLNEFLKEHRTVQEQKTTIAELRQNFAQQQKQIEALIAGLQKVSAQLELNKPAPQTVVNNH